MKCSIMHEGKLEYQLVQKRPGRIIISAQSLSTLT